MEIKNKKVAIANEQLDQTKLMSFFGTAVHDIKAPFRNIGSYLDIIKTKLHECTGAEAISPYLERIDIARNKIAVLLDELLKFLKLSATEARIEVIDLNVLMQEIKQEYSGTDIQIKNDLPLISGDREMLKDMLQRIISNAVKFQRKEEALKISVSSETDDDFVRINISDNGMGIEEGYFEKIFEPFERLNSPDEYPGVGLGLSASRVIAKKHGGKIEVHSEKDKGSTFSITLPL